MATVRILYTGRGNSDSWEIRGRQVANAVGADAIPMATESHCRSSGLIIAVKRVPNELLFRIRDSGRQWVWDCVDAWPQGENRLMTRSEAMKWLDDELRRLMPYDVIWPTAAMRSDAGQGGIVIRHHAWATQKRNPIRDRLMVVGYQGNPRYLGSWGRPIKEACLRLGLEFRTQIEQLADVDVCLAVRAPEWSGYTAEKWKPGTKLENAHATGTPIICGFEAGYREIACGHERWASSPAEIEAHLRTMIDADVRAKISEAFVQHVYRIEDAANDMRKAFRQWT